MAWVGKGAPQRTKQLMLGQNADKKDQEKEGN